MTVAYFGLIPSSAGMVNILLLVFLLINLLLLIIPVIFVRLLRRMVLEVHCGTVEGSSVVAPKCEEAAAINLARHFTAAVLKAGVHWREENEKGIV